MTGMTHEQFEVIVAAQLAAATASNRAAGLDDAAALAKTTADFRGFYDALDRQDWEGAFKEFQDVAPLNPSPPPSP